MDNKKTIGNLKTISGNSGNSAGAHSLPNGTLLGQYKILSLLCKGGMGEVYKVEHTTLGLKYALKVLPEDFSNRSNAVDMFKAEARVMATLKHKNIVLVDEFGNSEGHYWLRMELIKGIEGSAEVRECGSSEVGENSTDSLITTLADFAKSTDGKIEQLILADILKQILTGLSFAHQHGAIHRDLKPSNILLQSMADGRLLAKIADFGLVKLVGEEWVRSQAKLSIRRSMSLGEEKSCRPSSSPRKNINNAFVGTFEYMSPEQRDGVEITEQGDLYSVGLIAYRLLTGKKLGLKLPSQIDGSLNHLWDDFIEKALEEELDARYQTADEMLNDLNDIIQKIKHLNVRSQKQNRKITFKGSHSQSTSIANQDSMWTVPDLGMEFLWIRAIHCWVGKYQVTNGEYRKFKSNHASKEHEGHTLNEERQPVVYVNFDDAQEYAEWLTNRECDAGRLPSGYRYRLPTKDEWTTFCQCGDGRKYPWGDYWPPSSGHAGNYADHTAKDSFVKMATIADYNDGFAVTCSVEKSWANKWGIYGVGGNVWECTRISPNDPSFDAWRGASWFNANESDLRSVYRSNYGASFRSSSYGFRLVLAK